MSILLQRNGQLPQGTLVKITDVPEGSAWHPYKENLIGISGYIDKYLGRDIINLAERISVTGPLSHGCLKCVDDHPLIVERLDDPDGNY